MDGNGVFIGIAGTFTASNGTISGGMIDLNDPLEGQLAAQPVTGGRYNIGVDGRPASSSGLLTLQTAAGNFVFDYVLTSSSHGFITLYDGTNGTGSGTLDLQNTTAQTDIDSQSYAFNFNGIGSFNSGTGAQTSFSVAGAVTLNASGGVASGIEDVNSNGFSACGTTGCTITSGSVDLTTVPGTATFTSSAGTYNFDVYPVSASHLKLIQTDAIPVVAGDMFTQASSIPTGNNVFSITGFDGLMGGPFSAAGIFDTDGNGNISTDSIEDINDFGTSETVGTVAGNGIISGTYTTPTGGRSVLTFSGLVNGNNLVGCSSCLFAAYPSTGGTQLIEIDGGGATDGVAYAQGASPGLGSTSGYAMNLAGFNGVEEDDIAEFTNNGGTLTGLIDFNDDASLTFDQKLTGSYSADGTVTGRGSVTPGNNFFSLVTYGVDASTVVFVEIDGNQLGLGSMETQSSTARSNAAADHLVVMKIKGAVKSAKNAMKRKK